MTERKTQKHTNRKKNKTV